MNSSSLKNFGMCNTCGSSNIETLFNLLPYVTGFRDHFFSQAPLTLVPSTNLYFTLGYLPVLLKKQSIHCNNTFRFMKS
jgi:hypothetical protein